MRWAPLLLLVLAACDRDISTRGNVKEPGIYVCSPQSVNGAPAEGRAYRLDTEAPDTWISVRGHRREVHFTDLNTGEPAMLTADGPYWCEREGGDS